MGRYEHPWSVNVQRKMVATTSAAGAGTAVTEFEGATDADTMPLSTPPNCLPVIYTFEAEPQPRPASAPPNQARSGVPFEPRCSFLFLHVHVSCLVWPSYLAGSTLWWREEMEMDGLVCSSPVLSCSQASSWLLPSAESYFTLFS